MARRETAEAVGFTPSLRMKMRRFELGEVERGKRYFVIPYIKLRH